MRKDRRQKPSSPPIPPPTGSVQVIHYNIESAQVLPDICPIPPDGVLWISVCGVTSQSHLPRLQEIFPVHPLVLEDILNTRQRPKVEDYGGYLYGVMRKFRYAHYETESEQVSFLISDHCVISLEESETSAFAAVQKQILEGKSPLRERGEDFLLYTLMDQIIDGYLVVDEQISGDIDALEDEMSLQAQKEQFLRLQALRRSLLHLRRNFVPVREILHQLMRSDIDFFEEKNKYFLKDAEDHILRAIDSVDTSREMVTSLSELFFSMQNNRMNQVIRTLTIISTLFIPLTFLVGVYGMNFHHMPELHWKWSYPLLWVFMIALSIGMMIYFRRNKWF